MTLPGLVPAELGGLRLPARFVTRATIDRFPDRSLRVSASDEAGPPALADYTAVICDGGAYHYFHFMEAMIWLWVVQHAFLGGAPPARIVFANPWDNPAQNHVQIGVLGALYPGASLLDPGGAWPATFENVLVYDRSWAEGTLKLNKILESCMGFGRPHVMEMARAARMAVGAFGGGRAGPPHFLHVTRPPPRCFEARAKADLLDVLRPFGPVADVDFAGLPWAQQVRIAAAHDVMAGVHGNGLTNALWMRPGSLVLEFFPPGARHYDFQLFAELCGLRYFGFEGEHVFPAFSRTGAPYGHHEKTNAGVPLVNVQAVREVLEGAG